MIGPRQMGVILLTAVVGAGQARAQTGASVHTTVDTTFMTVGDRLIVSVTVDAAADAAVVWPDSADWGAFEMIGRRDRPVEAVDGGVRRRAEYVLTSFELGEVDLPSVDVLVVGANRDTVRLGTDGWVIEVSSVGRDESGDIRGVKGPMEIPREWWRSLPWVFAVALAAGALIWWVRRRPERQAPEVRIPAAPPQPAHEWAVQALDRLERSGLLDRGEIKEFHIRISDIVRGYFERRYGFLAMEMATPEVIDALVQTSITDEVRQESHRFLEQCDLVKFAKYRPLPEDARGLLPAARSLVDRTRHVPEEAARSPVRVEEFASP